MSVLTSKTAEVLFDNAKETYENQVDLLPLTMFEEPDGAKMQNSGNFIWRPRQQHAPIITGWDLTGAETGIIEEEYPAVLGTPTNDLVKVRADDMRDMRFWERRGKQSGRRQASELNKAIASAIAVQGSLFIRSTATSGYEFISEGQAQMNERQLVDNGRYFMLNDRDTLTFGADLAARQTLQGRPEKTWAKGQIGANVADFDVYTGSFLPNLVGGADPATTVTGAHSFAPEAGSISATGVVTNVDCRTADFTVADSSSYNVGDKVTIANSGTTIKAVGLDDKTNTGQAMTFSIVAIADATTITVYPKPIAADDAALSTLQKAYANVDTTALNAATVNRLNVDATAKTNLFWDKGAIEVLGGTIPANLFQQFAGFKSVVKTMENGQTMYLVYDGSIEELTFRFRLFTWYGITICSPHACGVAVTYSS
jgi:hypothetical protein